MVLASTSRTNLKLARSTARTRRHRGAGSTGDQAGACRPCANRRSRSARTCSPARPASARPKSPSSSPSLARRRTPALRHVGIHGAAHGFRGLHRCTSGLCRLRPGRPSDRRRRSASALRSCCLTRSRRRIQDIYNILLQVMDHGSLTDHNGKKIDFRNVILIMTTNAGANPKWRSRRSASARIEARPAKTTEALNKPVHAGIPQPPRCDDLSSHRCRRKSFIRWCRSS